MTMEEEASKYATRRKPCASCPYLKSTPSGVWAAEEYTRLCKYDGDMGSQLMEGGNGLFMCHQNNGEETTPCMCRGWTDTHGAENLVAICLSLSSGGGGSKFPDDLWEHSGADVYASGQEACDAGMRDIEQPQELAKKTQSLLLRKNKRLRTLDQ